MHMSSSAVPQRVVHPTAEAGIARGDQEHSPTPRIDALDFTKGCLVVIMVVYHCLNYSTQYYLAFRYLSFLPPSFILITGFILSHIYRARGATGNGALSRRLITRGFKLIALFTALNIVGLFVRSRNYHGPSRGIGNFFDSWAEIFVWGGSRGAAFEILLPIAYLLLLAPALLWATRRNRAILPLLTLALLGTCLVLDRTAGCPQNLSMIAAGIFGMLLGLVPRDALARLGKLLPVTLLLYAAEVAIGLHFTHALLHQWAGAVLVLAIIYGLGVLAGSIVWPSRRLIVLGQYSLVAYIVQIAILQAYSHVFGRPLPISTGMLLMLSFTLFLTMVAVEVTRWSENASTAFRRVYRAIIP